MQDINTTELKLKHTPTGGVDASHSLNWRDDLSSGVKGLYQGAIGGASLYGVIGLAIGGCLALATGSGMLIPLAAGAGILKGASTFGNMGSTAAIVSEAMERAERRRILLDRYAELPKGHEGDQEAAAILKELTRKRDDGPAPPLFHWKTVAMCAVIGAALMLGFSAFAPALLPEAGIIHSIALMVGHGGMALGASAGALVGSVVGLDRYYIRKWFDHTEGVVHSSAHQEIALAARQQQVDNIRTAAMADEKTKHAMRDAGLANATAEPKPATIAPAHMDQATHTISNARREGLIAALNQSMEVA